VRRRHEPEKPNFPPHRVTDLISFKNRGALSLGQVSFEILPVDFDHRDNPFQAYIFLSRYAGSIDGRNIPSENVMRGAVPTTCAPMFPRPS
jgi:hypothetical protein